MPAVPRTPARRATVLVADPTFASRHLAVVELHLRGYRVREAETGTAALAVAQQDAPDVILLNDRLPDGDGLDLVVTLAAHPATEGARLLLLCEHRSSLQLTHLAWPLLTGYLVRPVTAAQVSTAVHAALARSARVHALGTGAEKPALAGASPRYVVRWDAEQGGYRIWDTGQAQWGEAPAVHLERAAQRRANTLNARARRQP